MVAPREGVERRTDRLADALFTVVRGIGILGSTFAGSCTRLPVFGTGRKPCFRSLLGPDAQDYMWAHGVNVAPQKEDQRESQRVGLDGYPDRRFRGYRGVLPRRTGHRGRADANGL